VGWSCSGTGNRKGRKQIRSNPLIYRATSRLYRAIFGGNQHDPPCNSAVTAIVPQVFPATRSLHELCRWVVAEHCVCGFWLRSVVGDRLPPREESSKSSTRHSLMLETLLFAQRDAGYVELAVGADGHITGGRVIKGEFARGAFAIKADLKVGQPQIG